MQYSNLFPQSTAPIGFKKAMSDNWITTDGTGENKMVFRKVKKKECACNLISVHKVNSIYL